jgi:myo-inositol 2-dehydrogenase/D-chiro-inositol 1-dehydrogenase
MVSVAHFFYYQGNRLPNRHSLLERGIQLKQIVVGIIGAGRIGKIHAANLAGNSRVRVKTICDIQADDIRQWASQLGIEQVTVNSVDIMQDPEIDAILICSSTDTHIDYITQAAKAGKHIFCEKPISMDLNKTRAALKVVEDAGVIFQTGFNRRFDANFMKIKDAIGSGTIGVPHIIKITSRDPALPPYSYIETSGGMFMDMSIHDFDMARYVCGSDIVEVYVQGAVLVDPEVGKLGDVDTAIITLRFASGALGVIDNSRQAVYGYDQRVEVFGSEGNISAHNEYPNSVQWSTKEGEFRDNPQYFFLERYQESYRTEIHAFIDCILTDGTPLVGGYDSIQAELIARMVLLSHQEKRPVKVEEMLT